MKSLIKFTLFSLSTAFLISCSNSKPSTGGSSTGGTGGTGTGSSVSVPFLVEVRASYENNSSKTLFGSCSVSTSDPIGTTKTCTIRFPELLLYNSELEFYVATNNKNTCKKVSFVPYYYLKSNSSTMLIDNSAGTTADCSGQASPPECWGGAAPNIIEGFPASRGLYFLTVNQLSSKYELESSDIRQDGDTDRSFRTNANVANNISLAMRNGPSIDIQNTIRYIGGGGSNFQDYEFTCWDEWANINYRFTLKIADDDTLDTASDTLFDFYWDWGF